MKFKTIQEEFWAGKFGDDYISRNDTKKMVSAAINFYSKILEKTIGIKSVIEFGANIGNNLIAIKSLLPDCEVSAIEINKKAVQILRERMPPIYDSGIKIYNQSIIDFEVDYQRDLAFTKGVLIHINPDELHNVYQKIYDASKKYILIAEYYNPVPLVIPYRDNQDKLFKRDFAGEILDMFPDLKLIDCGFVYHRNNYFPDDDITWFLIEKR